MDEAAHRMSAAQSRALLAHEPVVHLAGTTSAGAPVLQTVHGMVLLDDALAFRGAPAGSGTDLLGREVVVAVEQIVAEIPGDFVDPEGALTTMRFSRAVRLHGVLEMLEDPEAKRRVIAALMQHFRAEGRPTPPLDRTALDGVPLVRVTLARIVGEATLGRELAPRARTRILEQLWSRGLATDPRAIELIRAAAPETAVPGFLRAPDGVRLACWLEPSAAEEAAALLEGSYWNVGQSPV